MPDSNERDVTLAQAERVGIRLDPSIAATLTSLHELVEQFQGLQNATIGPGMRALLDVMPKAEPRTPLPDIAATMANLETTRMEASARILADGLDGRRAAGVAAASPPLQPFPPLEEAPEEGREREQKDKGPAPASLAAFDAWTHYFHHNAVEPTVGITDLMRLVGAWAVKHEIEGCELLNERNTSFRAFMKRAVAALKRPAKPPQN
jgi:hypothetical protein